MALEQFFGRIVDMVRRTDGDELTAAAGIADTVLHVGDTADFDETGGVVEVDGDRYTYSTVDHDANTITLDTGLLAAAAVEDRVDVVDEELDEVVVEYVANVQLEDQDPGDQPIEVTVNHGLVNYLAEQVRGGFSESVTLLRDGDDDLVIWQVDGKIVTDIALEETRTEVSTLDADLTELNTVTLPALQADLATLDGKFPITSTDITDGAISTPKLAANSVSAEKIIAGAVSTDKLAANSVSADKIVANAVTAAKIAADAIDGKTITGAFVRTAATGGRVEISSTVPGGRIQFFGTGGTSSGYIDGVSLGAGVLYINAATAVFSADLEVNDDLDVHGTLGVDSGAGIFGGLTVYSGGATISGAVELNVLDGTGGSSFVMTGNDGVLSRGAPSSLRYKENVKPLDTRVADALLKVDAITWTYKDRKFHGDRTYAGVPAEQLHDLGLGLFVDYDDQGRPDQVRYWELVAPLITLCQSQQAQIDALTARLDALEAP